VSPLLVIFLTVFIDLLGFGIIIPLLPFYAEHFGASALMVGLLSTSFSVAQFLFAPFWGRLSDRIGRRPVILLGLLGSAVSYALFAVATSLAALFVARTLAGVAGANIPTAQAFIADTNCIVMKRHGITVLGRTVSECYHRVNTYHAEVKRQFMVELLCAAKGTQPEYMRKEEMEWMYAHGDGVVYPQLIRRDRA